MLDVHVFADSIVCVCLWIRVRNWHSASRTVSKDNIRTNILQFYGILQTTKLTSDHPCLSRLLIQDLFEMLDVDGGGSLSQEKLLRDLWILCCHGADLMRKISQ